MSGADALTAVLAASLVFGPVLLFLGSPEREAWRRLVLACALLLGLRYLYWRLTQTVPWGERGSGALYMQAVALVEVAWIVDVAIAYGFFWAAARPVPARLGGALAQALRTAPIDVFITTYNEGAEILERTVLAARRIVWDGTVTVCVLDDGRREWVGELCKRLGARWITRPDNRGFKAGNINHALQRTNGPFILLLDADFLAHPDAIHRLMPAMRSPRVAIAQAPHHYYNDDPVVRALGTAREFGDDLRMFFDRILPARDRGGYAFFCGSCALVRRAPLLEIGGLPYGSVTEDIQLTVYLRQRGYETRFVDAWVATGLAAETLRAFFVQRRRWARGAIQLLYLRAGLLGRGLRLRERIAFFPAYWIFTPLVRTVSLVIPQLYLLFGLAPLENATPSELVGYQGPLLVAMLGMQAFFYRRRWAPVPNFIWSDLVALRLAPSVLRDLLVPFGDRRFDVTPKGRVAGNEGAGEWMGAAIAAGAVATLIALVAGPVGRYADPYVAVAMFWAAVNLLRLLGMLAVTWNSPVEDPDPALEARCEASHGFALVDENGARMPLAGWRIGETRIRAPDPDRDFTACRLERRVGAAQPVVLANVDPSGRLRFVNKGAHASLLSMLVALKLDEPPPYRPAFALSRALGKMFGLSRSA